jgi:UDP-GlcNAc:undecaprenyl-phosphate GlcNAc-1-phosphate transferase
MRLLVLLLSAAAAALLSAALAPLTRRLAFAVGAIDRPGERKIHSTPIPRLGGLAVVASTAAIITVLAFLGKIDQEIAASDLLSGIALGLLPVLIFSIIDDVRSLPAFPKILAHTWGACIAVFGFGIKLGTTIHLFGREFHLGWMAIPISLLWIVGVTNAFNLIDGLDGLSAGLALISSVTLAGVSLLQGSYGVASLALILAGALLGFLPFNLYPARIFLGDSGAASVGYVLSVLVVGGISPRVSAGMAILVPVVVLGLPIADTLISICRRTLRRIITSERINILEGDRQHIHHRLLELGLHQKDAVLVLYVIGIALSGCAIGSMFMTSRNAALLLMTIMAASFVGISRLGYDEFALIRRGVVLRYYDAPVLRMSLFIVFVDLALSVVALYGAIVLKYEDPAFTSPLTRSFAAYLVTLLPALTLTFFCAFRIYWRTWRNPTPADMLRPAWAVVAAAATAHIICKVSMLERPGVAFFAIYGLILLPGVIGARASYRLLQEWTQRAATKTSGAMPVAIYAAGGRGAMALKNLLSNESYGMRPVGFIDDDPLKSGKYVNGYRVFGPAEILPGLIEREKLQAVVVASPRIGPERLRAVAEICRRTGTALLSYNVDFKLEEIREDASAPAAEQPIGIPILQPRISDLSH